MVLIVLGLFMPNPLNHFRAFLQTAGYDRAVNNLRDSISLKLLKISTVISTRRFIDFVLSGFKKVNSFFLIVTICIRFWIMSNGGYVFINGGLLPPFIKMLPAPLILAGF